MLDSDGRQVSVRNEIAGDVRPYQKLSENLWMSIGRLWNPHSWMIEPLIDLLPRCVDGEGLPEQPWICRQA